MFIEVIDKLKELDPTGKEGGISGMDIIKAWKLYRLARGRFLINQAEAAKKEMEEFEKVGEQRSAAVAYARFQEYVSALQGFISKGVGKRTDIYTEERRFITPGLARAAGVYQTPEQIIKKAAEPLGEEDIKLREVFDKLTESLKAEGGDVAPLEKIREALSELSGMDKGLVSVLTSAEKVKRIGPRVIEAWADMDKLSDRVTRLREALQQITKFNQDEFDAVQKKNLDNMIKYLKSVENMYSQMDLGKVMKKQEEYGEIGLIKVPKFMAPEEQRALHARNILKAREYFRRPAEEGGPEVGERFTYMTKVIGSAGEVIKHTAADFHKYGEVITKSGERVGKFSETQRDLIKNMQRSNASFGSAIKRVIMWGAASRLVYGGISYLSKSLAELSEVEQGIAQLRMVMSPLETDFNRMQKAAVALSKEYGVPTTAVLKSMKVFAQQGLTQQEVIERTGTATLASNVTTLDAKGATEALTAAMKIFRSEGQQSLRFLDAWSETEAKHAITAEDMANAIKKSAAAAKTAGVDFDELNGIVAAIGSVTRQSGKEVGTSLRFIFRRLFAEKGPKELAKLSIPVLEETGELRRGFDVLGDLADKWKNLTAAQKLSTAQAIGGTRQYNALIVLMNNWDEALRGIQNSVNSKGSAERRNIEIMKTYGKQLEQTKAAATELKLSLGKIVLPVFKTGLTAVRTLIEAINSIPNSLKAVAAFGALFVGYAAKGLSLVGGIRETLAKGGTLFGDLGEQLAKQLKIAKFEIFGKGTRGLETFGLKTVTPKSAEVASTLRKEGGLFVQQGKHLADFHSGLGQLLFMIKSVGDAYNNFIGSMIVGTGKATQKVGDLAMSAGDFMSFSAGLVKRDVTLGDAMQEASCFKSIRFCSRNSGIGTGSRWQGCK
jgi:TP901 family phage tail tape measure protein